MHHHPEIRRLECPDILSAATFIKLLASFQHMESLSKSQEVDLNNFANLLQLFYSSLEQSSSIGEFVQVSNVKELDLSSSWVQNITLVQLGLLGRFRRLRVLNLAY